MNGAGTPSDPFQIVTGADLASATGPYYYKVMNDINLSSYSNWNPVNVANGAVIDGNGKAISGLKISRTTASFPNTPVGLFGENYGTIKNLRINYGSVKGKNETGAFVGRNNGIIQKCGVCYVNTCEGGSSVGLFVGNNQGLIEDCFSTGEAYSGTGDYVGGFAGRNTGTIRRSYCAVKVYSSPSTSPYRGGFVGNYVDGTIELCAHDTSVNGGLKDTGYIQRDLPGVYGLDSSSMKNKNVAPFTSWDFDTTWQIGTADYNNSYFIHQYIQPVVEDRTVTSFIKQIFSAITGIGLDGRVASSYVAKIDSDVSTERQATVEVGSFIKAINAVALKTNPRYVIKSFINKINSSIGTERKATVEMKSTAGTIKSNVSSNRIATVSGSSYVRQIESEASNRRKFRAEAVAFVSPLDAMTQVSVKVVAKSYAGKILTDADLEGNNFKVLKVKVRKIKASATPFRNHIVVLESFVRGIRTFASTQIKDKILAKLNLNNDWTDKVIVGDTIKITLDIESKSGSQAHVVDGTLKIMDSEKNVLVTYELGDLEEISFGVYELLYTVPDGYGPLYAEFTAMTDEYPIATRLKLDRQWI
mgnify:CR=1 FL=1